MGTFNIYTKNRFYIDYQTIDKFNFLIQDHPVFYILRIDSYSPDEVTAFQKILSVNEKEKASSFRFLTDRISYIVTHARLRQILGQYLECDPAKIEFVLNNRGKPSLTDSYKIIHFNLSHRSGISIIGFDTKSVIGVDIEIIDPDFDFDPIVRNHFTQAENNFIFESLEESRLKFYTLWTRKEAFLKAIGTGIGENLEVEVFKCFHQFKPMRPIAGIHPDDFYLNTFVFQQNYLITIANNYPDGLVGLIDLQRLDY